MQIVDTIYIYIYEYLYIIYIFTLYKIQIV